MQKRLEKYMLNSKGHSRYKITLAQTYIDNKATTTNKHCARIATDENKFDRRYGASEITIKACSKEILNDQVKKILQLLSPDQEVKVFCLEDLRG